MVGPLLILFCSLINPISDSSLNLQGWGCLMLLSSNSLCSPIPGPEKKIHLMTYCTSNWYDRLPSCYCSIDHLFLGNCGRTQFPRNQFSESQLTKWSACQIFQVHSFTKHLFFRNQFTKNQFTQGYFAESLLAKLNISQILIFRYLLKVYSKVIWVFSMVLKALFWGFSCYLVLDLV